MPSPRNEHTSGVQPVGEYAPGARMVQPEGQRGTRVVQGDYAVPPPNRERRAVTERREREAEKAANPPKRGRPVGSHNRPPIPSEMFDAPPDQE